MRFQKFNHNSVYVRLVGSLVVGWCSLLSLESKAVTPTFKKRGSVSIARSVKTKGKVAKATVFKPLPSKQRETTLPEAKPAKAPRFPINGPYSLAVSQSLGELWWRDSEYAVSGVDRASDPAEERFMGGNYPSALPTSGHLSSGYGLRRSPFHRRIVHHRGIDYAVRQGADIYATADGTVIYSGWKGTLGKMVAVDHGGGVVTRYAHASRILVRKGDKVKRGTVVAKAGSTGRSTGPHLHYEIWVNGRAADPRPFLRSSGSMVLVLQDRGST
jgi:murein DD-endopeptidase MepM/ murein hydrolase activator NlpD